MIAYQGRALGKRLHDEGVLPPNARLIELVVPADGAVVLRYEVFATDADLVKIARAIASLIGGEAPEPAPPRIEVVS